MTPTAPELLYGCAAALATPPAPEEMGAFFAGKIVVVALLAGFAAQECATGSAVRVWENGVLRALLADAAGRYDDAPAADEAGDGDYSLAALDTANAELRRRLIRLHAAAEAAGDDALDRRILALYREMAARRMLHLPSAG
jgi:hypothetical protein